MCVPVERALRIPVPHNSTSAGPCCPDPEEDISGLHLRHGVRLATSHSPVVNGRQVGSLLALFLDHSTFLLLSVLVGGPWIQKRIYRGGACHMGFGQQPRALLLSMGGALVLHCHCPLAAPLCHHLGLLMGGLHSPPLLLGLRGPLGLHIGHLVWGALLLWPFLRLSLVRSRVFHHWGHLL